MTTNQENLEIAKKMANLPEIEVIRVAMFGEWVWISYCESHLGIEIVEAEGECGKDCMHYGIELLAAKVEENL